MVRARGGPNWAAYRPHPTMVGLSQGRSYTFPGFCTDHLKHPCGSSGGSAVSVAAGFGPIAFGSETQGSISCPASFTAIYGLKASGGLVSRFGILPSTSSLDSPGIFAKSSWGIASVLSAISGFDARDSLTVAAKPYEGTNYTRNLKSTWKDWRVGIAEREYFWTDYGAEDASEELKVDFPAETL